MSESKMTPEHATALRRPFPPESIGKLPKGGAMLDFAGHAAVTDRLLSVDPEWSWDFAECDPATGKPSLRFSLDPEKNLWIRLTICGVTRIGVGDGPTAKERIGDALRNGAMRFGVGLDLWAKENLVEFAQAAHAHRTDSPAATRGEATGGEIPSSPPESPMLNTSSGIAKRMFALMGDAGITDRELRLAFVAETVGREITSSKEMTDHDAGAVIKRLEGMLDKPFGEGEER